MSQYGGSAAALLQFCISDGDRQGFHDNMIIVIRVFHLNFTAVKRNNCF